MGGMRDRMDDADDHEIAFCLGFLTVTVGKKKPFCETKVPFFFTMSSDLHYFDNTSQSQG